MVRALTRALWVSLAISFHCCIFQLPYYARAGDDAQNRDGREVLASPPSSHPSNWPTREPSNVPSNRPSEIPSNTPTKQPVNERTKRPTKVPTKMPNKWPTTRPTKRPTKRPTRRPTAQNTSVHFVMVVIDDMGFGDLGFKGTSGIKTPVMDSLVATGTHLTNYYVLPACSHTRVAIMTGKYPYRSGIFKVVEPGRTFGMKSTDRTVANVLRAKGYRAHAVGKWHLGNAWYDYLPTFRGFESFLGIWSNGDYFNHSTLAEEVYSMIWDKEEFCGRNCSQVADRRGMYSTKVFTDRAVQVIDASVHEEDPLFLYLAYQGVHTPYETPYSYKEPYLSKPWTEGKKTYAGMLAAVDEGIGRVVQALKDNGMWKDTVLIITTDNGASISPDGSEEVQVGWTNDTANDDLAYDDDEVPQSGIGPHKLDKGGSNFPLRGEKLQVFEGGIRADGIISGPGCAKLGIQPGKNPRLFHAVDWLPTLEDLARIDHGRPRPGIDGVSQKQSLLGGPAARKEAFLGYGVKSRDRPITKMVAAYRQGNMKLIRYERGEFMLYDLAKDIRESNNLIDRPAYKELVASLKRKIRTYDRSGFTKTTENLGQCPAKQYGTTKWGQNAWIPWCEPDYRTPLLPLASDV